MPHLQQGAKVIGKKALQAGVNVAQDVLDGDNIKKAISKSTKQALGLPAQNSLQGQPGAGKKTIKRKAPGSKFSSPPARKPKHLRKRRNLNKGTLPNFLTKNRMAFVHQKSRECIKSELARLEIFGSIPDNFCRDRAKPGS